ncbi:MAG: hypothetical protein H6807_05090 [Planctomycetes bacterium]|nr:hypothetical protein [Planctomycetota bacterium]
MRRKRTIDPARTATDVEAELAELHARFEDLARRLFLSRPHARDVVRSLPPFEAGFRLGFSGRGEERVEEVRRLLGRLEAHIDDAIASHAAYVPGVVYNFFKNAACPETGRPRSPREVFVGYGETGAPRFQTMLDFAIERGDPGVDQLAGERGRVVIIASDRDDLVARRLPGFGRQDRAYDLRGQIVLGYFSGTNGAGREKYAVSLQLVRTSTRSRSVRLSLNTIGLLPDGRSAEILLVEDVDHQVSRLVRAAERDLARINSELKGLDPRRRMPHAEEAARSLLHDMALGLGRERRRAGWRTEHARERADEGQRPTGMARHDLERARAERCFQDQKTGTFVVMGGRGRTHVFSPEGLHVTSLHLDRKAIETRIAQKRWLPLTEEATRDLLDRARAAFERAAD